MSARFTIEERVYIVLCCARNEPYLTFKANFELMFNKQAPARKNAFLLFKKFQQTGSVGDAPRSGRKSLQNERTARVLEIYTARPRNSIRRTSLETAIPQTSIKRILSDKLGLRSYSVYTVQHLLPGDYGKRLRMCDMLLLMDTTIGLFDNLIFSDESVFHVCNHPNRQNTRIWASQQPHFQLEYMRDTPKTTVWLAIHKNTVIGPYFFDTNVNGEAYLKMLREFLIPRLELLGIKDTVYFQQDGAPCHYTRAVRDYLDAELPGRWIGRGGPLEWAPRSPDLTPLDFSIWGYLKQAVYAVPVSSLAALKLKIEEEVQKVSAEMLERIFKNVRARMEACSIAGGEHIEPFNKYIAALFIF